MSKTETTSSQTEWTTTPNFHHSTFPNGISGFPPSRTKCRRLPVHFGTYGSLHPIRPGTCIQRDKSAKTVAENHTMTSSCGSGSPRQPATIRGVNSRLNCFTIWINSLESAILERHHTIPKAIDWLKSLIEHLLSMLRTLPEKHKNRWRNHLNKMVHEYNFTRNDSKG